MQVNICHRLIKQMTETGHTFIYYENGKPTPMNVPKGLYATEAYLPGDVILHLSGTLLLKPSRTSIHIGHDMHVEDKMGQYINHSFEPNTRIVLNRVVAIKPIKPFEEITFNYNETEVDMAHPFESDGITVCGLVRSSAV